MYPCRPDGLLGDMEIDSVEFKFTLLRSKEPQLQKVLRKARATPVRGKVFFYDTPDLALYRKHLVLRGRVKDGADDDSTVKLRPLPKRGIPARWDADEATCELDVVGAKKVESLKLDHEPAQGRVEKVAHGELKLRKLFSETQEAVIADTLRNGTALDDLAVLGPVDARKWKLTPPSFPYELAVEEWSLPDGSRFFEVSFKVGPEETEDAKPAFESLLRELKIGPKGDPSAKTPKVLKFFAARLRPA